MFGCLFGVMNFANFRPIAPERGIPSDTSEEVSHDVLKFGEWARFPTWITWDEIKAIDWNEMGIKCDRRVHKYLKQGDGQLPFVSKGVLPNSDKLNFEVENSWEADGTV